MSGLRFAIEFSLYLLSCLIAIGSFIYINYSFARKSFHNIISVLKFYIFYFCMLFVVFFLPHIYIGIIACFPSSAWASNDAAISLVFWMCFVLPCFSISHVTLFIILIIKILSPKKELQTKSDSADASSE